MENYTKTVFKKYSKKLMEHQIDFDIEKQQASLE